MVARAFPACGGAALASGRLFLSSQARPVRTRLQPNGGTGLPACAAAG